jgi:Tol biopolymer transport system component
LDVILKPDRGFALSPDGTRLAFVAQDSRGVTGLWVRSLANPQALALAGTDGGSWPFWSPDGRSIGFFADRKLKRVPAEGGTVQSLAEPTIEPKGGAWSPDGRIVYVPDYRTPLFEVAATGGPSRALTTLDVGGGELSHRWPQFLPDGKTLIFLVQTAEAGDPGDRSRIEALESTGMRHEVLKVNASAAYAPPRRLLFWRQGSIYAQELDARLRLQGMANLVAKGAGLNASELAAFTVSNEGTLVYHNSAALMASRMARPRGKAAFHRYGA